MNGLTDTLRAWGCDTGFALAQLGEDPVCYRAALAAFLREAAEMRLEQLPLLQEKAAELGLHPLWQEAWLTRRAVQSGDPAAVREAALRLRGELRRLRDILRRY